MLLSSFFHLADRGTGSVENTSLTSDAQIQEFAPLRDWVDALAAGSVCQGSLASALASRVSAPCIRQLADLGWNFMSAFAVQVMDRELAQAISAIIGAAKL